METTMDEIQTRANEWAEKRTMPKSQLAHAVICYMNGALEQLEIDIKRACEIRCNLCAGLCKGNSACGELKEITKYMKG